jgi:hypothetical protein
LGEWEEGERVQREMGRRILRVSRDTRNEAVLGELGWWRLSTRRDYCKIKYWIKILLMPSSRLVKKMYQISKANYLNKGLNNWCKVIHRLAIRYGLEDIWKNEALIRQPLDLQESNLQKRWNNIIYKKIHATEEKEWLIAMNTQRKTNVQSKLRTYVTFKKKLELENYLTSEKQKIARYQLTKIRTGKSKLRIETGRHKVPKEEVHERVCRACLSGEVEDEKHFILDCKMYASMRNDMYEHISKNTNQYYQLASMSREQIWNLLMAPKDNKLEISEPLKSYVSCAMTRRAQI